MILKATKISVLSGVSRITLNKLFKQIRTLIAKECENISKLQGEMQIDESYFGAKRIRGKRGRGAGGKTPVFFTQLCFAHFARRNVKKRW